MTAGGRKVQSIQYSVPERMNSSVENEKNLKRTDCMQKIYTADRTAFGNERAAEKKFTSESKDISGNISENISGDKCLQGEKITPGLIVRIVVVAALICAMLSAI